MSHLGDYLSCQSARLGDEARAALAGEIRPEPLALHAQPVLQLRQGKDVDERPHQPREEAACVQPAPLQHRVILADDGHVALVEIAERTFDRPPLQLFVDQPPDVPPFLNRRLRHAGHGMSVLHHRRRVADNEHSGRVHDFQEWINERPLRAVGFGTEHLWNRRRCDPAVHSTVTLGILLPPAITPLSSTVSTLTSVTTFTPSFSRRLATLRDTDSAKVGRTRLAPSMRMMLAFAG